MSSSVQVILDNYDGVCYPGQTIAGRVQCYFHSEKQLRGVRIKFSGIAETEWHESESYYDYHAKRHKSRSVRYSAEETYFHAEYNLLQGGDNFQLPPGTHTYPFSYILPAQLPSSFEGGYGTVRYYIKATVDRPWKFDYENVIALNVVSPLDLNYLPGVREPVAVSADKTMCSCWCNDSGALTLNISLPASGFVPGQEVNIGTYVQNMTNVSAQNVKFKIVAEMEFITHYPSTRRRYDEKTIAGCLEPGVGAHGEKSWTAKINIPTNMPYPNLIPCSIINLHYRLKAEVIVPCPHTNLDMEIPVMIGTVPLAGVATTFSGSPPPQIQFPVPATEGTPLMPSMGGGLYTSGDAKYPPDNNVPYPPSGGGAPYPPSGAPYPPGGTSNHFGDTKDPSAPPGGAPYPANTSNNYGEKTPSAPPGGAPYPSGGSPYPPAGASSPSAPPPVGGAPYPSGGSAPYPPGAPAPYPSNGAPYPPASASSNFAPPSYDEAQKSTEKSLIPE